MKGVLACVYTRTRLLFQEIRDDVQESFLVPMLTSQEVVEIQYITVSKLAGREILEIRSSISD
jgi:hypothetical protein